MLKILTVNKGIIMFFGIFILLTSCNSDNCIESTGEIIKKRIDYTYFNSIEINDVFQVEVKQNSDYYVIIETGENIIDGILCNLNDSGLVIENNNGCNWARSFDRPKLLICSPNIDEIVVLGESDIFSTDTLFLNDLIFTVYAGASSANLLLDCNSLKFSVNQGTGIFKFSGDASISYLYNVGTAIINAENLNSYYSYITNNSTGNIFLRVNSLLDVKLRSSGNVYYYGDPETINISEQSSTGELIKLED